MKAILGMFALAALVTVAVGGPLAMAHELGHSSTCFLATVADLPCLTVGTVLDHVATLQRMLVGLPVALALVLLATVLVRGLPDPRLAVAPDTPPWLGWLSIASSQSHAPALRWHARLTHSPTLA